MTMPGRFLLSNVGALIAAAMGLGPQTPPRYRRARPAPRWERPHQGRRECARRRRQIEAGTLVTSGHKPRARIENWSIRRLGRSTRMSGVVYGHPQIPDGTEIVTSAVLLLGGERAETRNTVYRLGTPAE